MDDTLRVALWDDGEGFGGVERHIVEILGHLDRTTFEPVVYCRPVEELLTAARELDVPVHVVPRLRGKADLRYHATVAREVRRARPHVFHAMLTHSYASLSPIVAARAAGARVVATAHCPTNSGDRLQELGRRFAMRRVDLQVAPSEYVAETLSAMSQRLPRLAVVRNGIDVPEPLPREEARRRLGIGGPQPLIGAVLRLVVSKRVDVLLDAAALLPEAAVVVIGDGPDRERIEALARPGSVRFVGFRPDAARLLSAFDVFVHPTPTEAQGLAVLEAMAAGVPIVAADTGGTAESIDDGRTGLLVPAEGRAVANAVRRLLEDGELARRLAAAASHEVRTRFSGADMTRQLERLYLELAR